jgi:hypothetical protein
MAVWTEVPLSRVQEFSRTDAEYFKATYEASFRRVSFCKGEKIARIATVTDGIHGSPEITEDGIRYISAKCVKDNEFVIDGCINISHKQHEANPRTQLREGDVIITTVGTIGNVAVVDEDIMPCNCDRHVGIIRIKEPNDFSPFYLSTFLNSKYGQFQSLRESAGNVQLNLYIKNIGYIVVPRFGGAEEEIAKLTRTAYLMRRKAKTIYTHAQQLLESELGLNKLKFSKPMGYTARFSDAVTGGRIDADYFQPQYGAVRALFQSYPGGYEPLLNCADSLRPNIDPSKAPNHLFNYIELSNINASLGIVEGFLPSTGANLPSRAKRQVKTGDVIASAVVGSVDKAAIIAEEQNGFLASTGFFHLRPKSVSPMYLLMLVRSQCVRMQFQQQSTGGILSAVPDSRLKHVIIPKLSVALQEEINSLVTKSHSAKHTSDVLLNQAKTSVEQLIEEAVKS